MTVPGNCALCLSPGVALQKGHIMPAWVNKRLRAKGAKPGDPITVAGGKAIQTSRQETEYMLCVECEQRIGQWEGYVSTLASKEDGTPYPFPRRAVPPDPSGRTARNVALADLSGVDVSKLVMFATSVIWRADTASIMQGRGTGLGPYADGFRKFLLGKGPFPQKATVLMAVLDPNLGENNERARGFCNVAAFPAFTNDGRYHSHMFGACGLYFQLLVGNKIPGQLRSLCLQHGRENAGLVRYPPNIGQFRRADRLFREASPKGKLLKRVPKKP